MTDLPDLTVGPFAVPGWICGLDFDPPSSEHHQGLGDDRQIIEVAVADSDMVPLPGGEEARVVVVNAERWNELLGYVLAAEQTLTSEGIGAGHPDESVPPPPGVLELAADLYEVSVCARWDLGMIGSDEHNATCTCPIARRSRGETIRCSRCRIDIDADKISEPCTGTDWMDRHADPGPHTPEES